MAEMAAENTSTRRRVKLYMLNENRAWDDNGTGHVSVTYSEKPKFMMLDVKSEIDGSTLLSSSVQLLTAYQKQQETLIVWSEGDNCDYALSFQEKKGCDEVWEKICQFQGKDPSVDITQDVVDQNDEEDDADVGVPALKLPPCELSRLDEIATFFVSCLASPIKRERLSVAIESDAYITKLTDMFHTCEDAGNVDALHRLYGVIKSIFLLNKTALFEVMFADDLIFSVLGAMEYDPLLDKPADHRRYLSTETCLKQVIPLNNAALVQKIHQTYRMQYVMDVVLPTPPQSAIDDNALSTLSSFIFFNKMEIVTMIQDDDQFLKSLFAKLTDDETPDAMRRDLTLFLKEFCTFSQTLAQQSKDGFFKTLSNLGILEALEILLAMDDCQIKSAAVDIFCYIVEFSPATVREFMVREARQQDDEDQLVNLVLLQMTSDADPELGQALQLQSTVQVLVDPDSMSPTAKPLKTEVLSCFYRHCIHILTAPLFAHTVDNRPNRDDYQTAHLLSIIVELLTFCIEHHAHHIKNYVTSKNLIQRVLVLLNSKHAFLALAALRLLRKCIGLKDEFYYRHITRLDLFRPVVDVFVANAHKYNLLNSALIELFDFIRVEDIKTLITYLVEKHFGAFEGVTYVQTFKALRQRVQSLLTKPDSWKSTRSLDDDDDDDEAWFDEEDDELLPGGGESLATPCMIAARLSPDCDQINQYLDKGKLGTDSVSNHQVSRGAASPNGNVFTSQFGTSAAGTPLRGTISIKLSSQSSTATALRGNNAVSSLAAADAGDNEETNSSPRRTSLVSSADSSSQVTSVTDHAAGDTVRADSPPADVIVQNNKVLGHGLVDYPDEDSDEDIDEDESETDEATSAPTAKKPRVTSSSS